MSGQRCLGSSWGKASYRICSSIQWPQDLLGTFQDGELGGISDVDRKVLCRLCQPQKALNLITDVAEASRLAAVAIDRQVFSTESLLHEVRNDSAIIELHARAIRIEDANNAGVHFVIAVIRHGERLR